MSCLNANTGQPTGNCAAVSAGKAHGNDCAAQAASTCGRTGSCNGAGACALWAAGTTCVAASCPAGATTQTKASLCDGNGTCAGQGNASCGVYKCNASNNMCRTTCTADGDCATNHSCQGGTCAKKPAGAVCGASAECASNVCGGRCCAAGTTCSCPQPSASNLLANAGFDSDITSGWTATAAAGSSGARTDPLDAHDCPYSKTLYIYHFGTAAAPTFSQCVPVMPSKNYNLAATMRNTCINAWCDVTWYTGANCSAAVTGFMSQAAGFGSSAFSRQIELATSPADAQSAKIVCQSSPPAPPNADCWTWVDEVYFGLSTASY
jgi:hypothetical protein